MAEGGTISDLKAADFLFSCDASHPDTLRYLQATLPCLSGHNEEELEMEITVYLLETGNFSVLLDVGVKRDHLSPIFSAARAWPLTWTLSICPSSSRVVSVSPITPCGSLKSPHIQYF